MKKITICLWKKVALVCLFLSPIATVYADTNLLLQERQRVINQLAQGQQRINNYQAEYSAKLEAERKNQEYQQGLASARKHARKSEMPTEEQINRLGDFLSSDEAKSAVNNLNNLQPDRYQLQQLEPVEITGFDSNLYNQIESQVKYKDGNGGGVKEEELFPLNLPRQR